MAAFDRVEEDFVGLLYAFEEGIILRGAGGCFFIRMMAKNLFAVRALDLDFCCFVTVFRQTEDGVMILSLD